MRIICRKLGPKGWKMPVLAETHPGAIDRICRRWSSGGGQRIYCRDSTTFSLPCHRRRPKEGRVRFATESAAAVEIELPDVFSPPTHPIPDARSQIPDAISLRLQATETIRAGGRIWYPASGIRYLHLCRRRATALLVGVFEAAVASTVGTSRADAAPQF